MLAREVPAWAATDAPPRRLAQAAISVRLVAVSLTRMCSTCEATVFGAIDSSAAISAFVCPSAIRRATSNSRAVSGAHRSAAPDRPRASRSSSPARSASGRLPSVSAIERASATSSCASWGRRDRRWHDARSRRAQVPSQTRPIRSQPSHGGGELRPGLARLAAGQRDEPVGVVDGRLQGRDPAGPQDATHVVDPARRLPEPGPRAVPGCP